MKWCLVSRLLYPRLLTINKTHTRRREKKILANDDFFNSNNNEQTFA